MELRQAGQVFHFARISLKIDKGFADDTACIDTIFVAVGAEHATGVVFGHHERSSGVVLPVLGKRPERPAKQVFGGGNTGVVAKGGEDVQTVGNEALLIHLVWRYHSFDENPT